MSKTLPRDYITIQMKAKSILADIRKRAGNADGKHPTYQNILCYINTPEEESLFYFWYYQEYTKLRKVYPKDNLQVDRINNMFGYHLNNIQLIPMSLNERKKSEDHAIQFCGRVPKKYEKYCHSCKTIKIRQTDFNSDPNELDGKRAMCAKCSARRKREARAEKKKLQHAE